MKKIHALPLIVMCLFISGITEANGHTTYIPYHAQINQPTLNLAQAAKNNRDNSRSLQWKLQAQRHDTYDNSASVFNYADSTRYNYDANGNQDTIIGVGYAGGSWVNSQQIFYTFDNHSNPTYGIGYDWNSTSSMWVPFADVTQTFNSGNKMLTSVYRNYLSYLSGGWRNSNQQFYTYDGNNNNLTSLYQTWDTIASSWVNGNKTINTFDANNFQLTNVYQTWDAGLSTWANNTQDLYTNDAHGNATADIIQRWIGGAWVNYTKSINTYDGNNNRTEHIYQNWDNVNSVWANSAKYDYTYDAGNNIILEVYQTWDAVNSVWVNNSKYGYTFVNGNKHSTELDQHWDNTNHVWVNYYKNAYTYDGNFNETGYQSSNWNSGTSTWDGSQNYSYTYDSNNNRIYELDQDFNTTNLTFENTDQYFYYYAQLDVAAINEAHNQLNTTLYPNPSTGANITLYTALDNAADVRISLYDAQGKLITTRMLQLIAGSNTTELNYNNISSGNYFIQVLDNATGRGSIIKFAKQ